MEIYHIDKAEPLTEEEKKSPNAELYYFPIIEPDPSHMVFFSPGNSMDPKNALQINEIGKVFIPGSLKQDNGYCLLSDGTGYMVGHVIMPDVTKEMEEFWSNGWIGQSDVNYKSWFPGMHYTHQMPVKENLGWGIGYVQFEHPLIPSEFLSAPPEVLDSNFIDFSGCAGLFTLQDDPTDIWYNTVINCVRKCESGGVEVLTVSWTNVHYFNGEIIQKPSKNQKMDLERCRLYGCHHAYENTRKNQILPRAFEISKEIAK